ncbi:hypothetical protein [Stenotrophomonas sp.]|uniref:hypothetical protein n=1 Tax=Stenotrophomonas sp. TaxID=69392 RepID=UPI0028AA5D71|nr:hypothetical protein [Stenotrophomonas sp.]
MTRKKQAFVATILLIGSGIGFSALSGPIPPRDFGPLQCDSCKVAPYKPDKSTRVFLDTYRTNMARISNRLFKGDSITVCNSSFCAKYTISESDDFMGNGVLDNTPPSVGGGGGGGGGGGSGTGGGGGSGGFVGGGCNGNCGGGSGSVTVGPHKPPVPTQDF